MTIRIPPILDSEKEGQVKEAWTNHDEIMLMKGLILFYKKKGGDSSSPVFNSMLRREYDNNARRKKYNHTKHHDRKVFKLSKKIWGNNSDGKEPKLNGAAIKATES
ncbi:hypothetical protein TIFTF001_013921 [Ficus carica]|uniref:Uncharacterized protein n=1 Tax=Ficus carica TaxID=3494 RepID=A0AA88AIQ2_FICCA|nr:hypothetical protein TIFTF001_013921 [Ficus carica]